MKKDTVIKDANRNNRDVTDLEIGQSIRATLNPDVLYDCLVVEPNSDIADGSVNIFFSCYEVIILE